MVCISQAILAFASCTPHLIADAGEIDSGVRDAGHDCRNLLMRNGNGDLTQEQSGLVQCTDRGIFRERDVVCVDQTPEASVPECSDLQEVPVCERGQPGVVDYSPYECGCVFPCVSNSDCLPEEVCVCAGEASVIPLAASAPSNRCVPALCRTAEDCAAGEVCGATASNCRGSGDVEQFACRSPNAPCQSSADCAANEVCNYISPGSWLCTATVECE
jgi:hypothetical protein